MKTSLTYRNLIVALVAILFAFTLPGVSHAQAFSHIYVDAVNGINAPTGRGSAANPYKSITYALLISTRSNLPDPWHVHIQPGTYNADPARPPAEREVFPLNLRQEMIFEGTTTAEACVIDAQHTGDSLVPILSGENTERITIRNLTIQNSLRTNGVGGIVLHDPTGTKETPSKLENCIIHNNRGGGVWSNMPLIVTGNTVSNNQGIGIWTNKSAAVTNNTFSGNGGGMHIHANTAGDIFENIFQGNTRSGLLIGGKLEGNLTQNTFTNNRGGNGGGFQIGTIVGNVTHNTFTNNRGNGTTSTGSGGGGFFTGNLIGDVTQNKFTDNSSRKLGAGFYVPNITGNISHNTFTGNVADRKGGGFLIGYLTGTITHNNFTRNTAGNAGGCFLFYELTGNVSHNIFDSNSARTGGAIAAETATDTTVEVFNNIFFNNTATGNGGSVITRQSIHFLNNLFMISDELSEGGFGQHTIWLSSPECRFHNNIFSGVKTVIYTEGTFDLPITHNLFHNIKIDFVEQAGNNLGNDLLFWELLAVNATDNLEGDPFLVDPVTTRDFHLRSTSPAIDAGTNEFAPADDLEGATRPVGVTVDIGPYEYGGVPAREDPQDDLIIDGPIASAETYPAWDVNADGKTDITDLVAVATALGTRSPENPRLDVNGDGTVNIQDLILVATHLGEVAGPAAPVIVALPERFTPETLQQMLDRLRIQNDGSDAFQRAIANLEQLLTALMPKETALLVNYPNPFNPETWIPYQLAKSADVTLRIHAVDGTLVRTLSLGHKVVGIYQTRSRAAYWDGKNEGGEPVASGVYFYTLTADDFIATRKMLIRK